MRQGGLVHCPFQEWDRSRAAGVVHDGDEWDRRTLAAVCALDVAAWEPALLLAGLGTKDRKENAEDEKEQNKEKLANFKFAAQYSFRVRRMPGTRTLPPPEA